MSEALAASPAAATRFRDAIELAKPKITGMVVFTTAMGLWAAPGSIGAARAFLLLAATTMLVASANVFNSWYERDTDALMIRTRNRPLPAGRFDPWSAFAIAILLGVFAIPILALAINPLTALLGAIAHATYVLVYTPLKRVSPWALEIGAIPGAVPPLMGWAAATNGVAMGGMLLFGILFFWQIPHFIAIALYLREDYARAGLRVVSVARGERPARIGLLVYTVLLVGWSFLALPLGRAGAGYAIVAGLAGAGFLAFAVKGLRHDAGGAWARRVMLYSLVYLVAIVGALVLDAR